MALPFPEHKADGVLPRAIAETRQQTQVAQRTAVAAQLALPAGLIVAWPAPSPTDPTGGWVECTGAANVLSKAAYPALWAVLSTVAGNPHDLGGDNFIPPDYRNHYLKGAVGAPGVSGGENTVKLVANDLPVHTHSAGSLVTASNGAHTHTFSGDRATNNTATGAGGVITTLSSNAAGNQDAITTSDGAHTHTISGTTGDGGFTNTAHQNEPLHYTVRWFIKT